MLDVSFLPQSNLVFITRAGAGIIRRILMFLEAFICPELAPGKDFNISKLRKSQDNEGKIFIMTVI